MTSRERTSGATIDAYLAALAARLTVEPAESATILEEIRGHLEEATAAEVGRGAIAAEAESRAVATFGDVSATAHSINATLPVYWDMRRMLLGIVQGALAIWVIWTLATFPFVVPMAAEHQLDVSTSPASLLFTASPLGFGLFYVLRNGPWAALLILALFGAIAFALGSRASNGARAGLAFGLGVVVGLPFLLPAIFYTNSFIRPLAMLLFIVPIWLLAPYAMLAAWLGARITRMRAPRTLSRPLSVVRAARGAVTTAHALRRLSAVSVVGLVLLVTLLGVGGWSFVRAGTIAPPAIVPIPQQLATAQRSLPFTIHQPGYLPAGAVLTRVDMAEAWCGPRCAVTLNYRNPDGSWLDLLVIPHDPSRPLAIEPGAPPPLPSSPDAPGAFASVSVGSYHQVWWLGAVEKTEQQRSLSWDDGTLEYVLITNAPLSADTLRQIAHSLSG